MTIPVIIICGSLIAIGSAKNEQGRVYINSALAILYLVLPSISTTIFKVFPCDEFDDGKVMLRADYRISCLSKDRVYFQVYGTVMVSLLVVFLGFVEIFLTPVPWQLLLFPLGVPLFFLFLLWGKRG